MTRPAWLQERRQYLGASEVAAVCGLCPFKTPLDIWALKVGLADSEDSVAADMGNLFEAPLLAYYAGRHKRTLTQPGTLRKGWMGATPDAIADGVRNVQVKVVGEYMTWHWRSGNALEVPDYVQVQTQWEMGIAGMSVTDVVANLGGTAYEEFEVKADPTALGYLVEICERFWRDNVLGGVMPDIDGSDSARAILARKFPRPTAGMGQAVPEFVEMAKQYHALTQQESGAKREKKLIGNAMCAAIGDATGLKWDGGYVSWKPDKDGERRLYVHAKE